MTMDLFVLKKIVSRLFFPLPLCLELLALGLMLHLFSRRKKTASLLMGSGFFLLLLFSLHGPSNLLLDSLETAYPPAFAEANSTAHLPPIQWIVVLGGGTVPAPDRPANSSLNGSSLARLVEGIRLSRIFPEAHLIVTGAGAADGSDSTAGLMARAALSLGVEKSRIILLDTARDTPDEARMAGAIIPAQSPALLVTSASHMVRAQRLFLAQGIDALPAPTFFLHTTASPRTIMDIIPSADNLRRSERAVYEYLGLAWSQIRGLI